MCKDRFRKKWILSENIAVIERFSEHKKTAIIEWNYEIFVQDEASFEINKSTNRVLMMKWSKVRLKLENFMHDWFKICWFLDMLWKAILQIMIGNTWEDFKNMIVAFDDTKNNDKLKIIIVDNNAIHFTINVLSECLQRNILIIPMPRCSPHLNPIERLWRMAKKEVKAKYEKLEDMKQWVMEYAEQNLFDGLVKNYWMKYIS